MITRLTIILNRNGGNMLVEPEGKAAVSASPALRDSKWPEDYAPTPWRLESYTGEHGLRGWEVLDAVGASVCTIISPTIIGKVLGTVITATPDLLKALKTVVRQMEGRHPVGNDAFLAARRAIAKAAKQFPNVERTSARVNHSTPHRPKRKTAQ
jgi:hypothetical protein